MLTFVKYFNNHTCGFSKSSSMQIKQFFKILEFSVSDLLTYFVYSCWDVDFYKSLGIFSHHNFSNIHVSVSTGQMIFSSFSLQLFKNYCINCNISHCKGLLTSKSKELDPGLVWWLWLLPNIKYSQSTSVNQNYFTCALLSRPCACWFFSKIWDWVMHSSPALPCRNTAYIPFQEDTCAHKSLKQACPPLRIWTFHFPGC